jgi:Flp pilus assembly protein CpaB
MFVWLLACSQTLPPGNVWVVFPREDLPAGTVISAEDLGRTYLPADYVPQTAVVRDPALLVGRSTTARLLKHELVREERLGPPVVGATPNPEYGPAVGQLAPSKDDAVMVIVATRDLVPGTTIAEDDLYAVQIPPKYLAEGVFLSPEHVVTRTPCETIYQNEFIRAARLFDPGSPNCPK